MIATQRIRQLQAERKCYQLAKECYEAIARIEAVKKKLRSVEEK